MEKHKLANVGGKTGKRGDEMLVSLELSVVDQLQKEGLRELDSKRVAWEVVKGISKEYGGERIYIPKQSNRQRQKRDEQIVKEYDGGNLIELGIKFNLSTERVRQIIWEENDRRNGKVLASIKGVRDGAQ